MHTSASLAACAATSASQQPRIDLSIERLLLLLRITTDASAGSADTLTPRVVARGRIERGEQRAVEHERRVVEPGEMLAIVEDRRRVTTWTVTASPTNCDGATWNTGAGSWEIMVTETPVETCRLVPSTGRAVAEDLGNVSIFGAKTSGGSLQCDAANYSVGRTLRNITPVDTGALILTVPLE